MPKPDPQKLSAYGMIKRSRVLGSLSPEEIEAVEALEAWNRLSPTAEARLEALWDKAFDLHVPPQEDPLLAYAEGVGERMRARQDQKHEGR
jgi:hypothetical protein